MRNTKKQHQSKQGEVRIIGGEWRSRKLLVPQVEGLRPSTDRVRETVFNWLQPYLANSHCLDACAGSGALGFEALSRGASSVDFVEMNKQAIQTIEQNASLLTNANNYEQLLIHQASILDFLAQNKGSKQYDLIFVDPPFALNMHIDIFEALQKGQWLAEGALIYCEMPSTQSLELPENWQWFREKRSKNLVFGLIAV